ncbi:MAG TPA: tetratricopeptide repeat protein [Chthonomonadaceae bacterium]|nr:tetratricopeptide repeat protein [Chthonomonadaceae bacterium]
MSADPEHASLYERGWELFRLGRYADSLKTFTQALQRKPGDAWTLCGVSAAYYSLEDYPSALRFADQAVQSAPDDPEGHRRRSLCLVEMERKQEALAAAQEAVRLAPENSDCLVLLSLSLRALRNPDEAERVANRLLEVAPEKPVAYQELALVYYDQKRYQDAVETIRKGLELDPEDSDLVNNLAVALEQLGKREEALDAYYQALQRNPADKTAYRNLINHLEKCGIGSVEEYLRTRSDPLLGAECLQRAALIAQAQALSRSRQHRKAIQLLEQALRETPSAVPLYNALSEAHRQRGDGRKALDVATRAVQADSRDWRGHRWRAWVMLQLCNEPTFARDRDRLLHEGMESAQEAVRLSHERFICLDTLFRIQSALNLLEAAEQTVRRMVEVEPNWWRSYLKMGHLYRQKGNYPEAERWYRRAVDHKPDSAEANHELGLILRDQQKPEEAAPWFLQAQELEPTHPTYRKNAAKAAPRKKWFGLW